jgi:multimeric flavodoxin WrbA
MAAGVSLKILGIVCSPRSGGNTEILTRKALESAKTEGAEVEMWSIIGKDVKPCDHCGSCVKTGQCHIKDDVQALYPKLIEADGIILGSPVYFWSVTAQTKLVIDRTYALRRPTNRLEGKVGGAIAVAGRRGQVEALTVINNFFLGQGMIPAGLGVDGKGSEKGDIKEDERAMAGAAELGRRMVELIRRNTPRK